MVMSISALAIRTDSLLVRANDRRTPNLVTTFDLAPIIRIHSIRPQQIVTLWRKLVMPH